MLTSEIPFNGLEGLQVAWLVVEKNEVPSSTFTHSGNNVSKPKFTRNEAGGSRSDQFHDGPMQLRGRLTSVYRPRCGSVTAETNKPLIQTPLSLLWACAGLLKLNSPSVGSLLVGAGKED